MKTLYFLLMTVWLLGCSRTATQQPVTLTPEQAKVIARRFANEKAVALYGWQPFSDGEPARFVNGQWVWNDREGCGAGDLEAKVNLAADGSMRSVDVVLLINRAELF